MPERPIIEENIRAGEAVRPQRNGDELENSHGL